MHITFNDILKNPAPALGHEMEIDGCFGIVIKGRIPLASGSHEAFLENRTVRIDWNDLYERIKETAALFILGGGPIAIFEKCSLRGFLRSENSTPVIANVSKLTLFVDEENRPIEIN